MIHEAGNIGLNAALRRRPHGFGGDVENLQVDINNPTDIESRIKGALQSDPAIDAVLTLNSQVADRAVDREGRAAREARGRHVRPQRRRGRRDQATGVLFAVDQQQYEQGYLPIVMLKLYRDNANTVGGGKSVLTGPGFVDKSNADLVRPYTERDTR